jgi:hypothetical protein
MITWANGGRDPATANGRWRAWAWVLVALIGYASVPAWPAPAAPAEDEDESAEMAKLPPGEKAARKACTMCHVFPTPDLLDKKHWREQVLPRMKVRLGLAIPDYSTTPDAALIQERKIYTDKPMVPPDQWPLIEEFYEKNAPEEPLPQDAHGEIKVGLPCFRLEPPRFRQPIPQTTLVKISPASHRIFVGDDKSQSLFILDADGRGLEQYTLDNIPADVVERPEGLYVTCVGSFIPTERYCASFVFLPRDGESFGEPKVILKDLPRACQAAFADFNGDGKPDFALCMFGNLTGRFSWFENLGEGQYREHVLANHSGSEACVVHDFNKDGKPDLAVLMANEVEMIIIMLNDGKGNFTSQMVLQKPPAYGHVTFELDDFNGDGRMDLLVVNGDNGEYDSPLKKYHGLRIYLDKGDLEFEEAFFYPLNGAYKAIARDFDGDGKLDIAAISYFPDYVKSPRESFVFLRGEGGLKFSASTFRECIAGRWLVMDAGDLDGDGRPDLVLGSYATGPGAAPAFLQKMWKEQGPSVVILRNTRP